jgi:hypothetical protein
MESNERVYIIREARNQRRCYKCMWSDLVCADCYKIVCQNSQSHRYGESVSPFAPACGEFQRTRKMEV